MFEKLSELFTRTRRIQFLDRRDWIQFLLCILIIGAYLLILQGGQLERIENNFLDYLIRQRPPLTTHPDIVIIEIGQDSLQSIGRWPWPWNYHAEMVRILTDWQAKSILFDMVFQEPALQDEKAELEQSLQKTNQVYLPVILESKIEKKIWVHALPIVLEPESGKKKWTHSVPEIEKYAKGLGHINVDLDSDGTLRRIEPYLSYAGESYPHLAVRLAYDFLNQELPPTSFGFSLPTDRNGEFLINWAGKWRDTFEHYSYADLIRSQQAIQQGLQPVISPEKIRGKICLIGLTAPGVASFKVNPLESAYPTVGIHANVVNSILTNQFIIPVSTNANAVVLGGIGLLASLLFILFRSAIFFMTGLALGGVLIAVGVIVFMQKGIWFFVFHPFLLVLSLFIFSTIYNQVMTAEERRRLFHLATRDGLTGLYVIRHFREISNQVVQDAHYRNEPLSMIVIDIDDFKPINDTYGHPVGDMVLKKTAQILQSYLRSKRPLHAVDLVARYGGEEFIVLLRNAKLEDAASKIAERLRQSVEKAVFRWHDVIIPVTISLGVATLHPGENIPDPMVHRADKALYRAKKQGKNQVCIET
jgi:diguanylate cyclase (GGDEF)-like protein